MINYLIKFDDLSLSTVRLFAYDEGNKNQVRKFNLIDVKEGLLPGKIGRAHVRTPVTEKSRMPSSA